MMDIDGFADLTVRLYQELERLHNLSESLLRSIEYRDMEESANQPDLALVGHLTASLAALAHKVAGQKEIPALLPDDLSLVEDLPLAIE